ncbi:hypothetical protein SGLAM104S_07864 [Streptomyces glaucescens]
MCAASPSRTRFPSDQRSLTTVRNVVHVDLLDRERPAAQRLGEDLGAPVDGLLLAEQVEAGGPPDLLAHLHDHGGGVGRVRVTVQLHHAVLGLGDLEAERLEGEVGGEPDVATAVGGHPGAEDMGVRLAGGAVHSVGRDDQVVGLPEPGRVRRLRLEAQLHTEGAAAFVQDLQEALPAEGGEAVAAGGVAGAPVGDVDVVPADEVPLEGLEDERVGVFDAAEGLVGEDDAEAEGVGGGVAFPHGDGAPGIEAFEQDGGVEAAGAAADDRDAEGVVRGRSRPWACHGHRPLHLGGRFSVNAAWNSL